MQPLFLKTKNGLTDEASQVSIFPMSDRFLEGQTALVTGGNRGIGRAVAVALAQAGAKVAITGRNPETLKKTAADLEKLTPGAWSKVCDVRSEKEQAAVFDEIRKRWNRLDICVPNAGVAVLAAASETTLEQWNTDIETNLTGTFLTAREALLLMRQTRTKGAILPIISQAGKLPFEKRASYCSSKWGALGFAKCLALEAKRDGVRVTAICPASVATDFQASNPAGTDWMLDAKDVAETVLFILRQPDRVEIEEITVRCRNSPKTK